MSCGKLKCGGPGAGKDFPEYEGPIPRESFVNRCLVCGNGDVKFLIAGLDTKFSLCKKHRTVYDHVGQTIDGIKVPVKVVELP